MTDKELFRLNSLQQAIRSYEKVLSELEKDHWLSFKTPSCEVPLPIPHRCDLKEWIEQQLAKAKKEFEEA